MQKCILVITDGIGLNDRLEYNSFYHAKKPNYDFLNQNAKFSRLKTSGNAVGLPDGQMGNSEVGHMSIGSGRVIYQNLVRIDNAIKDKSLENISILKDFLKKYKNIHIIGLYSDGGVHSSYIHFNEIAKIASVNNNIFMHLISDGRDVKPNSFKDFIKNNPSFITPSSISGRFYAMDRDNNLDRTNEYINMLFSKANKSDLEQYINDNYENKIYDEFFKPLNLGFDGIGKDDGVIIINYRSDRARQIASELKNRLSKNQVLCMCEYDEKLDLGVIFPKIDIKNTLAEVLSKNNLRQFHTAETEKYAHVSFFFNGGVEKEFLNEKRVLIPSPKVKSYDELPQMSAYLVCDEVIKAMNDGFDFIVVNFANGDMVGHTGNYEACIKAVECVDECLGKIIKACKENNYAMLLTSDHGNCEDMKDLNGNILTNHTTYDVGCWLYNYHKDSNLKDGSLANIAASVLKILNLNKPSEMEEGLF